MLASVLIISALFVIVGAFMWIKPSPRDKHLAGLRAAALTEGLKVHTLTMDDTSIEGRVSERRIMLAVYCLPHNFAKTSGMAFTVLRTSGVNSAFLPDGWKWADHRRSPEPVRDAFYRFVEGLPEAFLAVEVRFNNVGLVWDERGSVDELPLIRERLTHLIELLSASKT